MKVYEDLKCPICGKRLLIWGTYYLGSDDRDGVMYNARCEEHEDITIIVA